MNSDFSGNILTKRQVEKLRLALSTYQDGTGQLIFESDKNLPGWRDFERSAAFVFGGISQESKAVFDVLVPISPESEIYYGISCKMLETLRIVTKTGRITVEVSNSSGKFWDALRANGIDDYQYKPDIAGKILLNLIEKWYDEADLEQGGNIDLKKSFYLLLQWDKRSSTYQLFQFSIHLPNPKELSWSVNGRRLIGSDNSGIIIEWYGYSGGQLKYYPFANQAIWSSHVFQLEPLPANEFAYGLKRRIYEYFPKLWLAAEQL